MKKILTISDIVNLSGLILIGLLIWFAGPYLKIDGDAFLQSPLIRGSIIGGLFIFWLIKVTIYYVLDNYANKKIIDTLSDNKSNENIDPRTLKKSIPLLVRLLEKRFIWHSGKKAHTAQIPLFLVIGAPLSGKSTLLSQSGLTFFKLDPTTQKMLTDLKELNAGNWHLTQEGVFLEIDITLEKTNVLTLLKNLLKRHQFSQTFHGIILTQDIAHLLSLNEEETGAYAQIFEAYLTQLYKTLNIQVPLYLMFTKMDLISGFYEFFASHIHQKYENPFGYTLKESTPSLIQRVFSLHHDQLIAKIQNSISDNITFNHDSSTYNNAVNFVHQFLYIKVGIRNFLKTLFSNTFSENPYTLFGIYFSSAAEAYTAPTDYYASYLQKILTKTPQTEPLHYQTRSYFIKGFFKKHILGGKDFAINKQYRYKIITYMRYIILLPAIGLFSYYIFFSLISAFSLKNHTLKMTRMLQQYEHKEEKAHNDKELVDILPQLEPLRISMNINSYKKVKWYRPYTRYTLYKIDESMQRILIAALAKHYIPLLYKRIEGLLIDDNTPNEGMIHLLQTYLTLETGKMIDRPMFLNILSDDIKIRYKDRPDVCEKLLWYLNKTSFENRPPFLLNQALIKQKQHILENLSPYERVYTQLKQNADSQEVKFFIPSNAWDPYFKFVFKENQSFIPIFYTVDGYTEIFKKNAPAYIDAVLRADERIGLDNKTHSTTHTKENVLQKLTAYYAHYFLVHWHTFLNSIQLAPTPSLNELLKILNFLIGKDEALLKIVTFINHEIAQIAPLVPESPLKDLNEFSTLTSDKGLGTLQCVITNLSQFTQGINILLNSPDLNKACFLYAHSYLEGDPKHPIFVLKETINKVPSPLREWLQTIIKRTWDLIQHHATQYIDTTWHTTFYTYYYKEFCQTYPFLEKAPNDLDVTVFKELFGEKGMLETFYHSYFKPLINIIKYDPSDSNLDKPNAEKADIYKPALHMIESVLSFRDEFMNKSNNIHIPFYVESFTMDQNIASLSFFYGSNRLIYRHGPVQRKRFSWADVMTEQSTCKISITDFNQNETVRHFDGLWGIFKFIDHCKTTTRTNNQGILLSLPFSYSAQLVFDAPQLFQFLNGLRHLHLPESLSHAKYPSVDTNTLQMRQDY